MSRDTDRRQVYTAEDLAAEHTVLLDQRSVAFLQHTVDQLLGTSWWKSRIGVKPVSVVVNRSSQRSSYSHDQRLLSLSPRSLDLSTVSHELSHAAAFDLGVDGPVHGPRFRALHVLIRGALLGPACAADLAEVYHQFGLSVPRFDGLDHPAGEPVLDSSLYERTLVVGRPRPNQERPSGRGPIAL